MCIGFADAARVNEEGEQELSDFHTFVDLQGLLVRSELCCLGQLAGRREPLTVLHHTTQENLRLVCCCGNLPVDRSCQRPRELSREGASR